MISRNLFLTSPEQRGTDVRNLQVALNARLNARGEKRYGVVVDGVAGTETFHALGLAGYDLGLDVAIGHEGRLGVTRVIENPHLRNPVELERATQRSKTLAKHAEIYEGAVGLGRIPILAAHYIGIHENPFGSNRGDPEPDGWEKRLYGEDGIEWCGCFAGNMILLAGGHITIRCGYCPSIEADARSKQNGFDLWTPNHASAAPGWLALFCFNGTGVPQHVGIVEEITASGLRTIEGNTTGTNASYGGMVAREERPYSVVVGYARPRI